jgi:hypothetical protein
MAKFLLVVCRKYPQGTVMTEGQYQWFCTQMSSEDLVTHRTQIIDGEQAYRFASILDKRAEKLAMKQRLIVNKLAS